MTQAISARTSGNATRLLAEKFTHGMISNMFMKKMKKKNVTSRGRNRSAAGPSIGSAICSRTNSSPNSIIDWSFPGTVRGFRNANRKSRM